MSTSSAVEVLEQKAGGLGGAGNGASGVGGNGGGSSANPQRVYLTGMVIALGAILMFFMALISAAVVRRGLGIADWQPFTLPRILWLNAIVLVASSLTLGHSRRCLVAAREADYRHWWGVTSILGAFFLCGQLVAWRQLHAEGVLLGSNPASSFFYVFTAAHGLHLAGGIAGLVAVSCVQLRRITRATATQVVALYWHFLCALWLFILLMLLFWGR
jgi:cytochrome c oxidase subunit III